MHSIGEKPLVVKKLQEWALLCKKLQCIGGEKTSEKYVDISVLT